MANWPIFTHRHKTTEIDAYLMYFILLPLLNFHQSNIFSLSDYRTDMAYSVMLMIDVRCWLLWFYWPEGENWRRRGNNQEKLMANCVRYKKSTSKLNDYFVGLNSSIWPSYGWFSVQSFLFEPNTNKQKKMWNETRWFAMKIEKVHLSNRHRKWIQKKNKIHSSFSIPKCGFKWEKIQKHIHNWRETQVRRRGRRRRRSKEKILFKSNNNNDEYDDDEKVP